MEKLKALEKLYDLDTEYYNGTAHMQGWEPKTQNYLQGWEPKTQNYLPDWEPKTQNYFKFGQISPTPIMRNQVWAITLEENKSKIPKNENLFGNLIPQVIILCGVLILIVISVLMFGIFFGALVVSGK